MHILGHFRDVDRPDRFVWFRGYLDMTTRRDGLARFYLGGKAAFAVVAVRGKRQETAHAAQAA